MCSIGVSRIRISDHLDHSTFEEPTNQPWKRILWFIWCSMIRVIPDHWSWSRSTQRNASFLDSLGVIFLGKIYMLVKIVNCNLFTHGAFRSPWELVETCPWVLDRIRIWKWRSLRRGKNQSTRRKNLSEKKKKKKTNSTYIWRQKSTWK